MSEQIMAKSLPVDLVLATGRSALHGYRRYVTSLGWNRRRNRVDIGVRIELPAEVFTLPMMYTEKVKSYIKPINTMTW